MGDDLVPVEVEIDPLLGAPSLRAAEQLTIEATRGSEIVDRKGKMERRQAHPAALQAGRRFVEAFVSAA